MTPITSICLVFIILSNVVIPGESSYYSSPKALALYVFGDSIVDSGNNNFLLTVAKANYPPYGQNFTNGPTGRFTNGKTAADFTAEYLGLTYPPPYKSNQISFTGYNYASGSCGILPSTGGILPSTGRLVGCLSLDEQMRLFEETVTTILSPKLQNEVSGHLSKSIFLVVVGSNDYLLNYFDTFFPSTNPRSYNPQQFAQLLIDSLSQKLEKLYELGARKVMVSEIGPLGCLPAVVRKSKPRGRCDENKNKIVSIFNNLLPLMLNNLTSNLLDSHFVLIQSYNLTYDMIDTVNNPSKYGLSDSSKPCCVTGGGVLPTCVPALPGLLPPCSDPNNHFFWDAVHPTETVYSISASDFIHGSSGDFPKNLEELLQV